MTNLSLSDSSFSHTLTRGQWDELKKSLGETEKQITLRSKIASIRSITDVLNKGARILHFSGHGQKQFICIEQENEFGVAVSSTPDHLAAILRALPKATEIEFVFVSACHSEQYAQVFADFGIKHVVGIERQSPVRDLAAITFAEALYHQLFIGDTVENAFTTARLRVAGHQEFDRKYQPQTMNKEVQKFILIGSGPHTEPLSFCTQLPKGLVCDTTPQVTKYIPRSGAQYSHKIRQRSMYELMRLMRDNRVVTALGESGSGKSALAIACAEYMSERDCTFSWVSIKYPIDFEFEIERDCVSKDALASYLAMSMMLGAEVKTVDLLATELNKRQHPSWIVFDGVDAWEEKFVKILLGAGGFARRLLQKTTDKVHVCNFRVAV